MSTNSAIFKGFSATIVAGIATISFDRVNTWILLLSFIPVIVFAALDIYYLKLERKLRYLYDQVRKDEHVVDFSIDTRLDKKAAKARTIDCVKSPSVWLFYPAMTIILVVVLVFKIMEVL